MACEELTDLSPNAPGIFTGFSLDGCKQEITGTDDLDYDRFDDVCERVLADEFAPTFFFDPSECNGSNWDNTASRIGGEYYYLTTFLPLTFDQRILVVYLPAYYKDCGMFGHRGDSEFIGVDLAFEPATNHWVTQRVFFSSHCGYNGLDYYCGWRENDVLYTQKARGAPKVYVSEAKHGNYPTVAICNEAYIFSPEHCDASTVPYRFPTASIRDNIGSRSYQMPWGERCPQARRSMPGLVDPDARECLWDTDSGGPGFRGWVYDWALSGSSTRYGNLLYTYFGL